MEEKENVANEKEIAQSKKGNNTAIVAIVILILVVAIGFRGYYFYKKMQVSNPVKITKNLLNDFANEYNKVLKNSDFYADGKNTQIKLSGKVSDFNFNLAGEFDLKNDKISFAANLDEKANSLFYMGGTLNKENALFQVAKDSNVYKMAGDFAELFEELSGYDKIMNNDLYDKFVSYLADSFEENVSKEDFTKDKEKITLFDKEVNATKFEKTFNEKELAKILSSYIDKLSKDEDVINLIIDFAKMTGEEVTKEEVKELLNDSKEELQGDLEEVSLKYTIYVYKTEVARVVFEEKNSNAKLSVDTYKNKSKVEVVSDANKYGITYDNKTNEYAVTMNNMNFITGTYKESEKKNDVSVELTFNVPLLLMSGEINARVAVDSDIKVDKLDEAKALDLTDEKNANKLMEELQSNEFFTGLMEGLSGSLSGSSEWDSIDGFDL